MPLVVLIPALAPSDNLLGVIDTLVADTRVKKLILINDGSPASCDAVFAAAIQRPKVTFLRHAVNLGKGAALRTGMNHFLCECGEDDVLITADADGQHLPADILNVGEKALANRDALILGCRTFSGAVPLRSWFGNTLTRRVFAMLSGHRLTDTQTGLRAIPRAFMPALQRVRAPGYDFEMEMLMLSSRLRIPLLTVPIQTVYENGNRCSHFNPVWDSVRIYLVFVRHSLVNLLAGALDFITFAFTLAASASLGWGVALGRIVAGMVKLLPGRTKNGNPAKLVLSLAFTGLLVWGGTSLLTAKLGWHPWLAKIIMEVLLFFGALLWPRRLVSSAKS